MANTEPLADYVKYADFENIAKLLCCLLAPGNEIWKLEFPVVI